MRVLLKWLGSISILMMYILCACVIWALPAGSRLRRALLLKNTALFAGLMLGLLGIRVHPGQRGRLPKKTGRTLIVANHVSYIDVLVIASLVPAVFITSMELGGTLFLGMLARLGGSLFVERRKVAGLKKEIAEISRVLREGHPVVLFPEGTTSNGERVHPFRNALFDAATTADADILPLCLRYTRLNGETLTPKTSDRIFYYGGAKFSLHFLRLLSIASAEVEVLPLPIIRVHQKDSRKELAALAHDAVSRAYKG
jgi:1-acyl-sn-glycerol-3-phosphate acyltransferase